MTQKRTRESMSGDGLAPAVIDLVVAVAEILDERWNTRSEFLKFVADHRPALKLSRQQLSKELGHRSRKHGPDWHIVELIVETSVPSARGQVTELEKLAGLYCQARGLEAIPGYQGKIKLPLGIASSTHLAAELDEIRTDRDQQRAKAKDLAAGLSQAEQHLDGLVDENLTLAKELRGRDLEIDKLRELISTQGARHSQEVRDLQIKLDTSQAVLNESERRLRNAAKQQRDILNLLDGLRGRYAWQVAHAAAISSSGPWQDDLQLGRDIPRDAPAAWRALAAYLHTYQQLSGQYLASLAQNAAVDFHALRLILSARQQPTRGECERIARAVGAPVTAALRLHIWATGDAGESIIGQRSHRGPRAQRLGAIDTTDDEDTVELRPDGTPASRSLSPGERDTPVPPGADPATRLSPILGYSPQRPSDSSGDPRGGCLGRIAFVATVTLACLNAVGFVVLVLGALSATGREQLVAFLALVLVSGVYAGLAIGTIRARATR